MSERGVFAVDRGIWDHPVFANEPFTEREAWQWLISEASFRSRRKRIGSTIFDLERGQLVASVRFMAEAWQWHRNRVCRFLAKLKTETMIEHQPGHDATKITICNYTKYQRVSLPAGTPIGTENGTATGQQRDKLEDIKNIELVAVAASGGALVSPEALVLAEKLLVVAGHDLSFWPPGWCGAPMRVQTWLNQGWKPEIIFAAVKGAAARKRGPPANSVQFFENAVAEEMARQSAPLPTVEIRDTPNLTLVHGKPKNAVIQAIDDLAERLASFDGPSRQPDELRSDQGETPPRVLSHGGRQ